MNKRARREGERPPVVRRMDLDFSGVPLHWFDDNVVVSHHIHGLNLVFPNGERFFVRSVLAFKDACADDPDLADRVRRFASQESQHGRTHEQANAALEAHGIEIASWLEWYDRVGRSGLEERMPPKLRLAATVALEHLTATLAEDALRERHLDRAHPAMRQLLLWHAAEEIEHRAVAWEVLQRVDPSYALRVAGLAWGVTSLTFFWRSATQHIMRQDPAATRPRRKRDLLRARALGISRRTVYRGLRDYLRRDFHPNDTPMDALAEAYLTEAGRLAG